METFQQLLITRFAPVSLLPAVLDILHAVATRLVAALPDAVDAAAAEEEEGDEDEGDEDDEPPPGRGVRVVDGGHEDLLVRRRDDGALVVADVRLRHVVDDQALLRDVVPGVGLIQPEHKGSVCQIFEIGPT